MLVSTTADEGSFFLLRQQGPIDDFPRERALTVLGALLAEDPAALYESTAQGLEADRRTPLAVTTTAVTRAMFEQPAEQWCRAATASGNRVYRIRYTRPTPIWGGWLGATHVLDVPVLFGNWNRPELRQLYEPADGIGEASHLMQERWARFVHTGRPASEEEWPAWRPEEPSTLTL